MRSAVGRAAVSMRSAVGRAAVSVPWGQAADGTRAGKQKQRDQKHELVLRLRYERRALPKISERFTIRSSFNPLFGPFL